MAARSGALVPIQMVLDGAVAEGAGTAVAASSPGLWIADPPGPNHVFLIVANSATTAQSVTVRAGGNGLTETGAANPGVPFEQATVGDEVTSIPASSTQVLGPFTTDRVTQADGAMFIDFAAGFTGTIWAFALPYNPISV